MYRQTHIPGRWRSHRNQHVGLIPLVLQDSSPGIGTEGRYIGSNVYDVVAVGIGMLNGIRQRGSGDFRKRPFDEPFAGIDCPAFLDDVLLALERDSVPGERGTVFVSVCPVRLADVDPGKAARHNVHARFRLPGKVVGMPVGPVIGLVVDCTATHIELACRFCAGPYSPLYDRAFPADIIEWYSIADARDLDPTSDRAGIAAIGPFRFYARNGGQVHGIHSNHGLRVRELRVKRPPLVSGTEFRELHFVEINRQFSEASQTAIGDQLSGHRHGREMGPIVSNTVDGPRRHMGVRVDTDQMGV